VEADVKLELMNAVVMAEDYERLRDWYIDALELTLEEEWTEKYHYAELVKDGRLVVGIASAEEMGVAPRERKSATVVAQLNVDDVRGFLARVKEKGADVPFGPSFDENGKFWFGGFADIEGNPVWVVEFPAKMGG
jgi:predicted enzyme related to lactoylglutathione lyase